MQIKYSAEIFKEDGKTMVRIKDHKNEHYETISLAEFNLKRSWYAQDGGIIISHRQ